MKNYLLPLVIFASSVVIGWFYYASEVNKQESIERQQRLSNEREELKIKQDECKSLAAGVMKKWNNVVGVTYDDLIWKDCVATYTDTITGEMTSSPLSQMKTVKE
jgi:hypothetical protein